MVASCNIHEEVCGQWWWSPDEQGINRFCKFVVVYVCTPLKNPLSDIFNPNKTKPKSTLQSPSKTCIKWKLILKKKKKAK